MVFAKIVGIILLILVALYVAIFFFAKRIETFLSFPKIGYEKFNNVNNYKTFFLEYSGTKQLFCVHKNTNSEKTVIYFYGNGGNLNIFTHEIEFIASLGYNVIACDFPGYGESSGFPFEENLYMANKAIYDYVITKGIKPEDLLVWGYSIGTAIATDFVSKHNVSQLILVAPFTSRYAMSQSLYGITVQKLLLLDNSLDTLNKISKLKIPILIIHGNEDKLVPCSMGKQLFEAITHEKKTFVTLQGGRHNGLIKYYGDYIRSEFFKHLDKIR